jgi:branched-chain amino acid aminotransferase
VEEQSAARLALPTFNGDALIELIKKLVMLDSKWIPSEPGHSLYIREFQTAYNRDTSSALKTDKCSPYPGPTMIGTQKALGVGPSSDALLFVICSPVSFAVAADQREELTKSRSNPQVGPYYASKTP